MGYKLKFKNLKIKKYVQSPSGRKLKNKYAVVNNNILVSSAKGLTKLQAKKELKRLKKAREFKFTG